MKHEIIIRDLNDLDRAAGQFLNETKGQNILALDNRLKILQHLAEPLGNANHFIDTYLTITIGVHIRERLLINLKTLHWTRQYGPHLLVQLTQMELMYTRVTPPMRANFHL